MHWLLLIPEKSHFRLILYPFWSKNLKIKFFIKTLFRSILSLYATVTFPKKPRKILTINFLKKLKKLILDQFWPLLAQNPENKIFP